MATPMYLRLVEHYAAEINAGRIKPGEWLPPQHKIAERWECSLTPVRHALAVMENMGLVDNYQGKGTQVR